MNINIIFYLFFSVLIIWEVSLVMIDRRNFSRFIPIFVMGILFCLEAAFIFYGVEYLIFFIAAKIVGIISLFFIFEEIRRFRKKCKK